MRPKRSVHAGPVGRRRPWLAAPLALLVGGGCMPSVAEAGASVLMASPFALAVGCGVLASLFAFEPRGAAPVWRPWPVVAGILVAAIGGLVAWTGPQGAVAGRWFSVALILYGASYITLLLATWVALRLAGAASAAYTWAWLPATLLQLVPAAIAAAGGDPGAWVELVWLDVGYFGVPPVLLFAVVLMVQILSARNAFPIDPEPPDEARTEPPQTVQSSSASPSQREK